jgi:hypothetical protein
VEKMNNRAGKEGMDLRMTSERQPPGTSSWQNRNDVSTLTSCEIACLLTCNRDRGKKFVKGEARDDDDFGVRLLKHI